MRFNIWKFIAALCFLGGIVCGVIAIHVLTPTPNKVEVLPTPTETVEVDEISAPVPPVYDGPVKFTVAPTATMTWSPRLEPADFVNIFQLVDPEKGYYESGGTVYLISHSYAAGSGAPGNEWETLVVGDVIIYNNMFYQVNRIGTPAQGDIASEPIWTNDPDNLVLLTCLSRGPGSPATNNFAISLNRI